LTPGKTYFYVVTATGQESGESPLSNEASVTLPSTGTNVQAIAISSGSLVGSDNFVQDIGYNLGATNAYPDVIDVSKVANPAPQGVYRTERWGPTTYTIPNLTPGGSYTVRLHFAETAVTAAGQRAFNVAINGTTVLSNFDIYAAAGGEFIANIQQFNVTADSSGTITIAFTLGTNGAPHTNPSLRGIEVLPPAGCTAPSTPTNFTASAVSTSEIDLSWTAVTGPACGGAVTYTVTRNGTQIASGLSATSLKDTGLAASTTYNYTVKAVNSVGASAAASASATTSSACTVPSAPSGLSATAASTTQINLSWTASTANCTPTYNVFRSTTSGFTPSSSNQIASGVSTTTFSNTGLTCNTAYFYLVEGTNSAGTSAPSNQASATTQTCPLTSIQINSGGPAVAPFVADEFFAGGSTINHANTIDLSGVTNPAPMAVYQTARIGGFTYTITGGGITAGSSHTVRLHFAETYWSSAGSRIFNVSINGTQVLTNFDIFAAAGAKNKAVIEQFTVNANTSGQYVIKFTSVKDNSLVSGIEIQ